MNTFLKIALVIGITVIMSVVFSVGFLIVWAAINIMIG